MPKKALLIAGLVFFIFSFGFGQEELPPPPPEDCDPDYDICEEDTAPIDDGVILLLIAGTLYGLKRIKSGDS